MNVVVRVDASSTIGHGHVMRCLTLAEALRERGAHVTFVSRKAPGHLGDVVEARDFDVQWLPAPSAATRDASSDADQTCEAIARLGKVDWLVIDHYGLDAAWERAMRAVGARVLAIDDIANRAHDCDVLLDQNLVRDMDTRYAGLVPAQCISLLGPTYALLRCEYAELHDRVPLREGPVRRVLVSFGGADHANVTGRCIAAFKRLGRAEVEMDVIVASTSPYASSINEEARAAVNVHVYRDLPSLAASMVRADLAVGASGSTSWERLCLGLPSLVITLADNQRPIAERLHELQLVRWLGDQDDVDEDSIANALKSWIDSEVDACWSERCLSIVDGRGASRVANLMTITKDTPLRVRYARRDDEARTLAWANDTETRRNGFSPQRISVETHHSWFRTKLRDVENCRLYIVETQDGEPVGPVRFERTGATWEINYAVAPVFRGHGLGRSVLAAAVERLRRDANGTAIVGRVRAENMASRRIFESLGFTEMPDATPEAISYQQPFKAV